MRRSLLFVSIAAITTLTGCGSVTVVRAPSDPDGTDTKTKGVRFYRPAPYLWITYFAPPAGQPSPTATFNSQIILLPDKEEEYIIQWESGWIGSIHPKFTIADGWNLTSFETDVNTGLSAALSLAGAASLVKTTTDKAEEIPGLYKLEYNKEKKAWTIGKRVSSLDGAVRP